MNKNNIWFNHVLQATLIVLSLIALVLLRQNIIQSTQICTVQIITNIIVIVFVVCSIALFAIGLFLNRKKAERDTRKDEENLAKLQHQAWADSLTELLNREGATEQISSFLSKAGQRGRHTLFMIDLDNFKSVNDTFGHFEGDRVLTILASKLKLAFRYGDIVGRLGGDEFVVLMKNTPTPDAVRKKAAELLSTFEYMTSADELSVTVTASIGISSYNGGDKTFETLYKQADEALYQAKLDGKNRYRHFDKGAMDAGDDQTGQKALKDSSASIQLKALIDNIDGGIALIEVSDEVRTIYLSRNCVRLMQLSYEGIKKADNRILRFIHKEDVDAVGRALRYGGESGESVESYFRKTTEDGRILWLHMRAVRIPFEPSENAVLIAIITDVTSLKEAQLNYEAQKQQLEMVLRVSDIVTFEVDINKRTLIMKDASLKKYGINVHTIEDMPESIIKIGAIHPDSLDECRRMYDEIYAGVEKGSSIIRAIKKNGENTIECFTYFTVYDSRGCPVKAVGVVQSLGALRNMSIQIDGITLQLKHYSYNTVMTLKINLADDSYESLKEDDALSELWEQEKTYSGLLKKLLMYIEHPQDREELAEAFSAEGLKRRFEQGQDVICMDCAAIDQQGRRQYFAISGLLNKNYLDDGLCVFVRVLDNNSIKQLESLLGVRLKRVSKLLCYPFEMLRATGNALIRLKNKKARCGVFVLAITGFDALEFQLGLKLMKILLYGFMGKVKLVLHPANIVSYNGDGSLTVLIPEVRSNEWLERLARQTIELLKKPAYFQCYEEDALDYRCGISVENEQTTCFDGLFREATKALDKACENVDNLVCFFNPNGEEDMKA